MTTPRLYYDDPWGAAFDASVIGHGRFADWASVILDRTGLYPEAGGQMSDRGWLVNADRRLEVADVQVDDDGVVHHRVSDLPPVGASVHVEVDRARRRVHMALHTGQHMLSRALLDEARAATVSARLGETACTIDVDVASLHDAALARAEDLVNAVIDDDRTIRAFFPSAEQLSRLELRRAPKVTDNVRVVAVDGELAASSGATASSAPSTSRPAVGRTARARARSASCGWSPPRGTRERCASPSWQAGVRATSWAQRSARSLHWRSA